MASDVREPLTAPGGSQPSGATSSGSAFRLRLRLDPHVWLTIAGVWAWLLCRSAPPFGLGTMAVLTPAFAVAAWLVYRGFARELLLARRDLAVFAAL